MSNDLTKLRSEVIAEMEKMASVVEYLDKQIEKAADDNGSGVLGNTAKAVGGAAMLGGAALGVHRGAQALANKHQLGEAYSKSRMGAAGAKLESGIVSGAKKVGKLLKLAEQEKQMSKAASLKTILAMLEEDQNKN